MESQPPPSPEVQVKVGRRHRGFFSMGVELAPFIDAQYPTLPTTDELSFGSRKMEAANGVEPDGHIR